MNKKQAGYTVYPADFFICLSMVKHYTLLWKQRKIFTVPIKPEGYITDIKDHTVGDKPTMWSYFVWHRLKTSLKNNCFR